ncbi:bifunctional DNA-formamidopyrimidine glycosylase/DNA-(apurinic or apyrimidinic site) lyase [Marinicella meishanensis]|uniref:bifunctional DNA-formamidopyrimidine glycosylase/DNA-(apurinic or apyrimidinic site) lyase n=1 Tax=Marinicella meishanensis TaxID=2873263 RepID=UPI001CBE0461
MPELPEVETTLRGIQPHVQDQEITAVNVYNPAMRWPIPPEVHELVGLEVVATRRRAKYLLLQLSDQQHLLLHLGMSGVIRVLDANTDLAKHDHFELVMANGLALRLNDPRRFGCVLLVGEQPEQHELLRQLGPEPLTDDFDGLRLKRLSAGKTAAVKNFIMDNRTVVGVGNIYAAESLFLAGIHPARSAQRIAQHRYDRLATQIKTVLHHAIQAGGTTLNDFRQSDGQPGYFKQKLYVYGREGQPCLVCGTAIQNRVIGQRASCFCPQCQT